MQQHKNSWSEILAINDRYKYQFPKVHWRSCKAHCTQRSHLEKLIVSKLIKQPPEFYGTRTFTSAFTTAHHLSLSWARSIRSASQNLISLFPFLTLFSHHRLGFPSGLLSSASPTPTMCASLLSTVLIRTAHEGRRPVSCYLFPLTSKFIHLRRNLEDPQYIFFCQCKAQV
jgi:hypothetical protein